MSPTIAEPEAIEMSNTIVFSRFDCTVGAVVLGFWAMSCKYFYSRTEKFFVCSENLCFGAYVCEFNTTTTQEKILFRADIFRNLKEGIGVDRWRGTSIGPVSPTLFQV